MAEQITIPAWKKWFIGIGDQVGFFIDFFKKVYITSNQLKTVNNKLLEIYRLQYKSSH